MTAVSGQYYHSFEGDVLDRIVWDHYTASSSSDELKSLGWVREGVAPPEVIQMVYDANPQLNKHGIILPEGVKIFLPDAAPPQKQEAMRLW